MLNNEKDRNWFLRCVFCVFVYNALVFICMYVCVCVCVCIPGAGCFLSWFFI